MCKNITRTIPVDPINRTLLFHKHVFMLIILIRLPRERMNETLAYSKTDA